MPTATPSVASASRAPAGTFTVATRSLALSRGEDRPLQTTVWYPVSAPGPFPLVLFSHGLGARPADYGEIISAIAAAGFVVAAPAYPHTSGTVTVAVTSELLEQPADAAEVITGVLALSETAGDPFEGLIDPTRVGAVGHSAGGYTTAGLLSLHRDPRVSAAVIIAGGSLGGTFTDPALPVLVIHGDADPVVNYAAGRSVFGQIPWPKAMLTVLGGGHSNFLSRDAPTATVVWAVLLDFLRWSLYGDATALERVVRDGQSPGVTTLELAL